MSLGFINPAEYRQHRAKPVEVTGARSKVDNDRLKELLERCQKHLIKVNNDDFVLAIFNEDARRRIKYNIADFIRSERSFKFAIDIDLVIEYIQTEITEMGVLQPALDDPTISSIEINGPHSVIVERNGFTEHMKSIRFQNVDHIYRTINKMLLPVGRTLTASEPNIDANYRGFRISISLDRSRGGISSDNPIISIRKFPPDIFTDAQCIAYGNISSDISEFLASVLPYGLSTIIAGGTNSGKTTQLLRFPMYYDNLTRFYTIEDSEELMFKRKKAYFNYENIVSVIVKEHEDARKAYPIAKLVKISLRQNPDVIIIGEVRDSDAAEQALVAGNTGHIVHLSIHSNSADDAMTRFLQLRNNDPIAASQISSCFDLILYQKYERTTGKRVVLEIVEVLGFKDGEAITHPIFKYDSFKHEFIQVGKLTKTSAKLISNEIPIDLLNRWCDQEYLEKMRSVSHVS